MSQRKTSKVPTRIITYGAKLPHQNRDLFVDQMFRAHRYHNALVAIEQERRKAVAAAEETLTESDLQHARELKAAHRKAVKDATSIAEKKRATEELKRKLSQIPGYAAIDKANEAAGAQQREARKASGLHFGTYLLVEKAVEAAKKQPQINFRRWSDHGGMLPGGKGKLVGGRLGAHIMGGARPYDLDKNTMLQIDWPDLPRTEDGLRWDVSRCERRRGGKTLARIRAGSDGRQPVWVEFRVSVDRPLPPDSRIKAAWLLVRLEGVIWRCELQLQVEAQWEAKMPAGKGTVAADLNWRVRDDGIRVAYLCDAKGVHREMIVPPDVGQDLDRADAIKSVADKSFDEARELLADELGNLSLPEAHQEKFKTIRQWKSSQRLARAVTWWWDARFDGDGNAWSTAYNWLQRWRHLYQYFVGARKRALRRRNKYYEDMAKRIARKYSHIVIGDFDMRPTVELDAAAADSPQRARHNRFAMSPSAFRLILHSTAARLGATVTKVNCADATQGCGKCGHVNEVDRFSVDFRCENCKTPWDRGHNHCINLLYRASGKVPPETVQPLAPMFPRTCATASQDRKIRERAKARRSKKKGQTHRKIDENRDTVTSRAQAVET